MAKRAEHLGPERRRPLVLDAARAIFAEGGFADSSMSAIASRAGVSKAVLYDCFPGGKQEIYYALLDTGEAAFMAHMMEVLERTRRLPLAEALREGIAGFIRYAEENADSFRIIFGESGTADPEISRRTRQTKELIVAKMGERTKQTLGTVGLASTPFMQVYDRSIVAVAEELARWVLNEPSVSSEALAEAAALWFMKGFERMMPEDAWRKPLEPAP